ncbi:MAG: YcjX family protein [Bacteroidales bacterium]|nr:YcjX family protein [Bacteroidales bacterium]
MSLFRVKTTECRVGVVGHSNAGKTVLLTSLINHLEHHDPDRFRLGDGSVRIRKFTALKPDAGWSAFHYPGFRDALVHRGKWPEKTRDRSQYACQFERSDWTFSDALLKMYDLPGERFADAAMVGRSFAEWSDHILAFIANDTPYRTCCQPFLNTLSEKPEETTLLTAYKLALANLILAYKPFISPSTFLLDTSGSVAKSSDASVMAATRLAGLELGAEFTPLSAELRQKYPELTAVFAARFERYRIEVVLPFLEALWSCHSLIVLVDIQMVLAAGVGMYDDNRQILRDLFQVLDPGESRFGYLRRNLGKVFLPHAWRPGWITRIAFVAPKMDLVHPMDRDHLESLLKRLIGKLAEDRDGLQARYFNCAAVVSARKLPVGEERVLVGIPYRDAEGRRIAPGAEQRFLVSALPADWPHDWKPGDYIFPEVYPAVPNRKDCPPDQINLDRILDFVLD